MSKKEQIKKTIKENSIRKNISLGAALLCFLIAFIRIIYGLFISNDGSPWYDYFVEVLFLTFIGIMLIRLAKTYK